MPFIWVKIFKTEKTIEIQEVRLTEVCGKVLSEKNAYKSVKTALLLSNGFDADHQHSCLFTNKGHFSFNSIGLVHTGSLEHLLMITTWEAYGYLTIYILISHVPNILNHNALSSQYQYITFCNSVG